MRDRPGIGSLSPLGPCRGPMSEPSSRVARLSLERGSWDVPKQLDRHSRLGRPRSGFSTRWSPCDAG
jgi:hypothetical protein